MNTIFIVLPILTLLMFDLGLTLRPHDFRLIVQRPLPVLAGVMGQILLLPLIAWAVGSLFHLEPLFFLGIMLIACSPGGSSSNVFSMLARGDVALSVTLTACSSVITLFTVPLIMAWVTTLVGTGAHVHLPVGNLLMQNLVLMAVPILVGLWGGSVGRMPLYASTTSCAVWPFLLSSCLRPSFSCSIVPPLYKNFLHWAVASLCSSCSQWVGDPCSHSCSVSQELNVAPSSLRWACKMRHKPSL